MLCMFSLFIVLNEFNHIDPFGSCLSHSNGAVNEQKKSNDITHHRIFSRSNRYYHWIDVVQHIKVELLEWLQGYLFRRWRAHYIRPHKAAVFSIPRSACVFHRPKLSFSVVILRNFETHTHSHTNTHTHGHRCIHTHILITYSSYSLQFKIFCFFFSNFKILFSFISIWVFHIFCCTCSLLILSFFVLFFFILCPQ